MPELRLNGAAPASGVVSLPVRPTGTLPWRVTQVSVEMVRTDSALVSGSATCVMRKNGALVTPLVAQGDAAGGDPPVYLQMSDELTIEWAGANLGDICRALVIYDLVT